MNRLGYHLNSWQSLAHYYWQLSLCPDEWAIDATCGNGKDTLYLIQTLKAGKVIALDIQPEALERAKMLLESSLSPSELHRVSLLQKSHTEMASLVLEGQIKLIIYNLGYLPGGDKKITTTSESTLTSIRKGLQLIAPGGALSITSYCGHPEGVKEAKALSRFLPTLDPKVWTATHHQWVNRQLSPSLLIIQKTGSS